ncbi:YkvA family protein [Pedobacter aquatilis]|uniref:YkvA family protein n=1 Tax=Pedobacter aquatilis TaxID=351343 RepID=UPI0029300568|nr:YkvA family protein [Pedobacter aquatilis]
MQLDRQKILDFFKKSESKAGVLLKDKRKAKQTINDALGKAVTNRGDLEGVWAKLILLFAIAKDYVAGNYTEIPKRSIIAILGGIIYFLSPVDIVPDFIPVLGFIDDVFVLNLVYKQVVKDLEQYKIWKDEQLTQNQLDGATT